MYKIHREGKQLTTASFIGMIILLIMFNTFTSIHFLIYIIPVFVFIFLVLQFFRNPDRPIQKQSDELIYAPADGKVVVIEEIFDHEYLNAKCLQISIFMSPLNVHVNRFPIDGEVQHVKYYEGKFLPAWNPKSSNENERTSIGIKSKHGKILIKQIAGAVARRIVYYPKIGDQAKQGEDLGFIKFGSRVDVLLPLKANILVKLNDTVKGNESILASFDLL